MRRIDEQFLETPFFGVRQMTWHLRNDGHLVNEKRIRRLMLLMGLMPIYQKPNTSRPAKGHKTYPYLLKGLRVDRPNQVWCSDITYLPMRRGFLYLAAIMDWHTRKVLAWRISMHWKCQGPQCGTQQRFGQSIIAFYSRDMIGSEARELEYVTEAGRLAIRPDHLSARSANPTVGDRVFDDNLRRRSFSWQGLQKSCSPHDLPGGYGLPCHLWIEGFWVAYSGFQGDRDIFNEAIPRRVSAFRAADNSGHLCPHFSGRALQRRLDTRDVNLLHRHHRGLCAGRCGPVRV